MPKIKNIYFKRRKKNDESLHVIDDIIINKHDYHLPNNDDLQSIFFGKQTIPKKTNPRINIDDLNNPDFVLENNLYEDVKLFSSFNKLINESIETNKNVNVTDIFKDSDKYNVCEFDTDFEDSMKEISDSVTRIINSLDDTKESTPTTNKLIVNEDKYFNEVVLDITNLKHNAIRPYQENYYKEGTFYCNKCPCQFDSYLKMRIHLEHFHNIDTVDCPKRKLLTSSISCVYCGMVCTQENELTEHILNTHASNCNFDCPVCGSTDHLDSRNSLIKHLKIVHEIELSTPIETDAMSLLLVRQTCKICDVKFLEQCNLEKHLALIQKFYCNACPASFDNLLLLTEHFDDEH